MEFGAREVALEAPEIFLAAPEMVPAKELEIAQSGQWVLSSPPWVSFVMADLLTG